MPFDVCLEMLRTAFLITLGTRDDTLALMLLNACYKFLRAY